jgi:thiol-disulfide isomerase/thioredoxin
MKQNTICFFIVILIILILIYIYYLDNNYSKTTKVNANFYVDADANAFKTTNAKYSQMVEDIQKDTIRKINQAVEQGYAEGFQAMNNEELDSTDSTDMKNVNNSSDDSADNFADMDDYMGDDITYTSEYDVKTFKNSSRKYKQQNKNKNNNDNIISYLNKGNSVRIMLFYKASCPYCTEFMPVWYKIINNLANNVMYEEIDCEKDYKKANEYQITSVPTIILLVNNEKKMYMGDRNYEDIMRFLKYNGVNLIERTFEEFDTTDYSESQTDSKKTNKSKCPTVSFDTQLDIAQDKYMFQIFNADGQYGYAVGGNNDGKLLTPFTAAYSTVDSYLTSLPEGANISECANTYSSEIRGFGLCDKEKLDNILQYQKNVANGSAKLKFDGTDYSSNKKVITAIKTACGL